MATNPNKQGTGYINIKNYLQANPNINLGQKIGSSYGKELESLDKSFKGAQSQFAKDLSKANIDSPEARAARENILANPEQATQDQGKLQEFSRYLNPTFQAPGTSGLETQAGISQQMAQDIINPAYRTNLLQRYYGQSPHSSYSTGQKTLDTVFLNKPQSSQALGDVRRGALQQLSQQRGALLGSQDQIQAAKKQTEQFGRDTQSQLNQRIGDYVDEKRGALTNRLSDWQKAQADQRTALGTALSTGQFSSDLANRLGITAGQRLYGLTPEQALNQANLSLSNIATPEERARVGALYKLRNETNPLENTQTITQDQATGLNQDFVKNYLQGQEGRYNQALSSFRFDPNLMGNSLGFYDPNSQASNFGVNTYIADNLPLMSKEQATKYFQDLEKYIGSLGPREQLSKSWGQPLYDERVRQLQEGRAKLADLLSNIDKDFNVGNTVKIKD